MTLMIKLGATAQEQTAHLQEIKDAMAAALIGRVEADSAGKDDRCCSVYIGIYLEASACISFLPQ